MKDNRYFSVALESSSILSSPLIHLIFTDLKNLQNRTFFQYSKFSNTDTSGSETSGTRNIRKIFHKIALALAPYTAETGIDEQKGETLNLKRSTRGKLSFRAGEMSWSHARAREESEREEFFSLINSWNGACNIVNRGPKREGGGRISWHSMGKLFR